MNKRTLVLGASDSPFRYAYRAVKSLERHGHLVIPLGNRKGMIDGIEVETEPKAYANINTVTIYIRPAIQKEYYDYILNTIQPKRIIFNPGAENPVLKTLAEDQGIETVEGCTLIMLSSGSY